ncbi:MAG: glycosyl transferase family 2 [Bacteroides sp. SM23_62_1]|nr:MAG: glycosyl transferase family 2 [Bacteroides sp. SM23_62_1]
MISLDNISIYFGGQTVFRDVSLRINPRDRIGLVGRNGAGKTTLLKIIAGMVEPSEGKVVRPDMLVTGFLPQQMKYQDKGTLWKEVKSAFAELNEVEKEMKLIEKELEVKSETNHEESSIMAQRLAELTDRHHLLGGTSLEATVEQTLAGLGFRRDEFHKPTAEFSGGWRMRIELAKLLLGNNDLLLLDEPTNHLDIESIQWLEKFLSDYPGAVVIISHDRAFLDSATHRTIEISMGSVYDYKVPYSEFRTLRQQRREQQLAAYRNQQKKIETTEKFIERFRYKATKATQVQSRIRQLDKMDRIEIELEDLAVFNIRFPSAPRSATLVLEAERLSKSFGTKEVIREVDLVVNRGEKVAFVGKNGEGKTTLSRIIAGELDRKGKLRIGQNVDIGYYAQNQDEIMDETKTVYETIDYEAVGELRTQIRNLLGAFLFHEDDIDKPVRVLSGGERSRLAIARLLLRPYNLLILDEPTNHLDMRSKDILKQALMKWDGTLIVVSHDREFLDGLVQKVYEFRDGKVREHLGGIYDFLQKKRIEDLSDLNMANIKKTGKNVAKKQENKLAYERKKEYEKQIRKIEKHIHLAEEHIAYLEREIEKLNRQMSKNAEVKDGMIFESYEQLTTSLSSEMKKWEELSRELDKLINL